MTVDFRDPERALRGTDAPALVPAQKFVLLALGFCAGAFLIAGGMLMWMPVSWLEPGIAFWVGLALVLSAAGDVAAAFFLRQLWLRAANRSR